MARVRSSVAARKRHKKVLKLAKGYRGGRSRLYRTAKEAVERGMVYASRDRKVKKRSFRRLWITRINAGVRENGMSYGDFIAGLRRAEVALDRKILAEVAANDSAAFKQLVQLSKENLGASEA